MVTKRIVDVPIDDIILLLKNSYPRTSILSQNTQTELEKLGLGSCLFSAGIILVPVWNARTSTSLLLDKMECTALLSRLTGEVVSRKKDSESNKRVGLDRDQKVEQGR